MKRYNINIEESRNLYDKHKDKVEPQNCYINIFNISTLCMSKFISGEWKIAYGYVSTVENVYCRHCFILEGNKVIDPTAFSWKHYNVKCTYYITKLFDSIGEYLDAVNAEGNYPALSKNLKSEDKKALEWALQNGLYFVG